MNMKYAMQESIDNGVSELLKDLNQSKFMLLEVAFTKAPLLESAPESSLMSMKGY